MEKELQARSHGAYLGKIARRFGASTASVLSVTFSKEKYAAFKPNVINKLKTSSSLTDTCVLQKTDVHIDISIDKNINKYI